MNCNRLIRKFQKLLNNKLKGGLPYDINHYSLCSFCAYTVADGINQLTDGVIVVGDHRPGRVRPRFHTLGVIVADAEQVQGRYRPAGWIFAKHQVEFAFPFGKAARGGGGAIRSGAVQTARIAGLLEQLPRRVAVGVIQIEPAEIEITHAIQIVPAGAKADHGRIIVRPAGPSLK